MNSLFALILTLVSITCRAAVIEPPNYFPFLLAQLTPKQNSAELGTMRLTQWVSPRRDGVFIPAYFELAEETCLNGNCQETFSQFQIVSKEMDTCHRVYFTATEASNKTPRTLRVVDHQGNFCPAEKKADWDVELLSPLSRTEYTANPFPVRHD